jgi:hypothetical protein
MYVATVQEAYREREVDRSALWPAQQQGHTVAFAVMTAADSVYPPNRDAYKNRDGRHRS